MHQSSFLLLSYAVSICAMWDYPYRPEAAEGYEVIGDRAPMTSSHHSLFDMLKRAKEEEAEAAQYQPNFVFVNEPRSDSAEDVSGGDDGTGGATDDAQEQGTPQPTTGPGDWQPGGVCLECHNQSTGLPKPHYAAAMGHLGCLMSIYSADMNSWLSFDSAERSPLFYACANVRIGT